MPRRKVTLRPNTWTIVSRAVEEGVGYALQRMDKHADDPLTAAQRARAQDHLERELMNTLSEVVKF